MDDQPRRLPGLAPSTILGIHHVGMAVSNLASALSFYRATASLEEIAPNLISGLLPTDPVRSAVLKAPNGFLQLMEFESTPIAPPSQAPLPVIGPGVTHICFQSPAADKLFEKFMSAGASSVIV